jgi:glycosyltransferase involved in cell wall biosynthesis
VPNSIPVIVPVLDEAGALPVVLSAVPPGFRAIVVDNGSSDGSGDIALALGAQVVTELQRGFGAACFAGLMATDPGDRVVCFMDGDASLNPADLPRVCADLVSGRADLVLGSRRPTSRGAWPAHARVANRVLAREIRRRTGQRLEDIGPMRAADRDMLVALGVRDRRFGWPLEMVLRASQAGWRITEVPVAYYPRAGRSKVTGTVRGTARAVRDMTRALALT